MATANTFLNDLIGSDTVYDKLKPYFEDITVGDISIISRDIFIRDLPHKVRLLGEKFADENLRDVFENRRILMKPHTLDYCKIFKSTVYAKFSVSDKLSFDVFGEKFEKDLNEEIKIVDLTKNNLFDEDIPIIVHNIAHLGSTFSLDIKLSDNKLTNIYALDELFACAAVNRVIIEVNQLDINHLVSWFNDKDRNGRWFQKLIWMPIMWIRLNGWTNIITDEETRCIIRSTHETYFA